jgi:hypothetical protein
MVACQDKIDVTILCALREAGATGRQSGELAVQLDIDHRDVSRRIDRMNKMMEQETGAQKLGQPVPESNFVSELNSSFPQPAHM